LWEYRDAPGFHLTDWRRACRLHERIDRFFGPETGLHTAPQPIQNLANLFAVDRLRLHVLIERVG
jgi:hypothetical protein